MTTSVSDCAFVVPADLPGPSGGSIYNQRVLGAWRQEGMRVAEEAVGGAWPYPDEQALQSLSQCLRRHRRVLVDGIIASAAPDVLAQARDAGVEVNILMHLPLPAETGLSAGQQDSAEARERRALQHAHLVICTSQWARRDVTARYGELPIAVAAPGCDAAPLATGSQPPHMFFLGTVSPRKNPLTVLRALNPLQHLDWSLSIAGPQGGDKEYAQAVSEAADALSDRVDLRGPLTGHCLELAWDAADLLILPSVVETYGMVVTEAIARGVPALVGSGTGAEEALAAAQDPTSAEDTSTLPGGAVDPADHAAWTEVLGRWLHQDDLRRQWRANAAADRDRLRPWTETAKNLHTALRW